MEITMKFSQKLLLWTTIIIAITLGFSGYYFVNFVFETSLEREVGQALDENSILRFAFETAALNVPVKYDVLQDSSVEQIASNLETSGQGTGRLLRICDEEKNVLYAGDGFEADDELINPIAWFCWGTVTIFRHRAAYIRLAESCIWRRCGM